MMTNKEKQLLLKDLCTRLPYKVKVGDDLGRMYELHIGNAYLIDLYYENGDYVEPPIKPYLRPMSSMTVEEVDELLNIRRKGRMKFSDMISECVEFYCSKHLDYNHLIEKGLALPAPEGMYKF